MRNATSKPNNPRDTLARIAENQSDQAPSLGDIAAATDAMLELLTSFMQSVDTTIVREARELSTYISTAKSQILALRPHELPRYEIPQAGQELMAIVTQTEAATHEIMEITEELLAMAKANPEALPGKIDDAATRIFEVCSFQDLTGQRIARVIETLNEVEARIGAIAALAGEAAAEFGEETAAAEAALERAANEATQAPTVQQDEVDRLLAERS